MRPGSLKAVLALLEKGHRVGSDASALSAGQLSLFRQECITVDGFAIAEADVIVDAHDNGLAIADFDGEFPFTGRDWGQMVRHLLEQRRTAERRRTTNETDIYIIVDLDGSGKSTIVTGLPFFDHMLDQIARHGFIDLEVQCKGDLHIDEHHTIEDVGITLGETLLQALGDKRGIERYGFVLAMDEALATVALDLSGRAYLVFEGEFNREKVGDFPTEMTKHFFYSLAMGLKSTLNIRFEGENDHHKIEACFKGFARTLKQAVAGNPKAPDAIPSSKGSL
ncbi:MAG: imidazoleglycerol-phosphate dehydratase HisB [Balneolales bacterium]|nr:imidazoleglycerol-phosphate dehydratase HisB [Balneolales bacterium]